MSVRIGMAQFYSPSLMEALPLIEGLAERECDIVLLPEKWMHIHNGNEVEDGHPFMARIREISLSCRSTILSGGLIERDGQQRYVTCYAVRGGELVAKFRKLHPFGPEKNMVSAGSSFATFEAGGCRVGIAICYDADFPETVRAYALMGCDMLVVPAKITATALEPWYAYLTVRALENRMFIASANVLSDENFRGGSGLVELELSRSGVVFPARRLMNVSDTSAVFDTNPERMREERSKRLMDRHRFDRLVFELEGRNGKVS